MKSLSIHLNGAFCPPERVYEVPLLLADDFYDVKQCLSFSAHVPRGLDLLERPRTIFRAV